MAKKCNDDRGIHKYHKVNTGFTTLWACAHPTCSHYMPKHIENMIQGKASICWECDGEMVLDTDALRMDKPICLNCRMPSKDTLREMFSSSKH
jgi:hypothetical protein